MFKSSVNMPRSPVEVGTTAVTSKFGHLYVEGLVSEEIMWAHFQERLQALISQDPAVFCASVASVLSIGPGKYVEKNSLEKILRREINYVGVELDAEKLPQKREEEAEGCYLTFGDCTKPDIVKKIKNKNKEQKFDLILFRHPLFDDINVLSKIISEYLKPNGRLIFSHHFQLEVSSHQRLLKMTCKSFSCYNILISEKAPFVYEKIAPPPLFREYQETLYYDKYMWMAKGVDVLPPSVVVPPPCYADFAGGFGF